MDGFSHHLTKHRCACSKSPIVSAKASIQPICLWALLGDHGQNLGKLEDQVGLRELWNFILAFEEGIFIKHGFIFIPATYESNFKKTNVLGTGLFCLSPLLLCFPTETAKQSRDQYLQMVLPQPRFLPGTSNALPRRQMDTVCRTLLTGEKPSLKTFDNQRGGTSASI